MSLWNDNNFIDVHDVKFSSANDSYIDDITRTLPHSKSGFRIYNSDKFLQAQPSFFYTTTELRQEKTPNLDGLQTLSFFVPALSQCYGTINHLRIPSSTSVRVNGDGLPVGNDFTDPGIIPVYKNKTDPAPYGKQGVDEISEENLPEEEPLIVPDELDFDMDRLRRLRDQPVSGVKKESVNYEDIANTIRNGIIDGFRSAKEENLFSFSGQGPPQPPPSPPKQKVSIDFDLTGKREDSPNLFNTQGITIDPQQIHNFIAPYFDRLSEFMRELQDERLETVDFFRDELLKYETIRDQNFFTYQESTLSKIEKMVSEIGRNITISIDKSTPSVVFKELSDQMSRSVNSLNESLQSFINNQAKMSSSTQMLANLSSKIEGGIKVESEEKVNVADFLSHLVVVLNENLLSQRQLIENLTGSYNMNAFLELQQRTSTEFLQSLRGFAVEAFKQIESIVQRISNISEQSQQSLNVLLSEIVKQLQLLQVKQQELTQFSTDFIKNSPTQDPERLNQFVENKLKTEENIKVELSSKQFANLSNRLQADLEFQKGLMNANLYPKIRNLLENNFVDVKLLKLFRNPDLLRNKGERVDAFNWGYTVYSDLRRIIVDQFENLKTLFLKYNDQTLLNEISQDDMNEILKFLANTQTSAGYQSLRSFDDSTVQNIKDYCMIIANPLGSFLQELYDVVSKKYTPYLQNVPAFKEFVQKYPDFIQYDPSTIDQRTKEALFNQYFTDLSISMQQKSFDEVFQQINSFNDKQFDELSNLFRVLFNVESAENFEHIIYQYSNATVELSNFTLQIIHDLYQSSKTVMQSPSDTFAFQMLVMRRLAEYTMKYPQYQSLFNNFVDFIALPRKYTQKILTDLENANEVGSIKQVLQAKKYLPISDDKLFAPFTIIRKEISSLPTLLTNFNEISQNNSTFWDGFCNFLRETKKGNGNYLKAILPYQVFVDFCNSNVGELKLQLYSYFSSNSQWFTSEEFTQLSQKLGLQYELFNLQNLREYILSELPLQEAIPLQLRYQKGTGVLAKNIVTGNSDGIKSEVKVEKIKKEKSGQKKGKIAEISRDYIDLTGDTEMVIENIEESKSLDKPPPPLETVQPKKSTWSKLLKREQPETKLEGRKEVNTFSVTPNNTNTSNFYNISTDLENTKTSLNEINSDFTVKKDLLELYENKIDVSVVNVIESQLKKDKNMTTAGLAMMFRDFIQSKYPSLSLYECHKMIEGIREEYLKNEVLEKEKNIKVETPSNRTNFAGISNIKSAIDKDPWLADTALYEKFQKLFIDQKIPYGQAINLISDLRRDVKAKKSFTKQLNFF